MLGIIAIVQKGNSGFFYPQITQISQITLIELIRDKTARQTGLFGYGIKMFLGVAHSKLLIGVGPGRAIFPYLH